MATITPVTQSYSPPVTSTGLGSGLDINGMVSQLMAVEAQPLQQLNVQEAGYQAQLSAYGQINSALSSFQSAVTGLESASSFQAIAATSADTSVFTATTTSGAVPGNYNVQVTNLASSQKLASQDFSGTDSVVGTGTLIFQFGTVTTDTNGNQTLNVNSAQAAQTVTIDSTNDTLSGVAGAINAANIGVSATIINDGTGYKLMLTSQNTGAANSLKITVSNDSDGDNTDNAGLSQLAYDPAASGQTMTQTVAAQDAAFTIDGLAITNPSNTITNAIQGVTLNLVGKNASGQSTALSVSSDSSSVQTSVQNFVSAYNALNQTLSSLTAYNSSTQQGGLLSGDATALGIQRHLRSMLTTNVSGLSGNYQSLSNIGVSFQADGTLALDTTKLQAAVSADPNAVANVFATVGTATDSLISYSAATNATQPGTYGVTVSQLATQGYSDGVTTSALANTNGTFTTPLVIDANNNTLTLSVDGVQTGTITLTPGSYTTAAALTAELQSKINGDSALKAAGSGVTVSFDNTTGKLNIASNRYGSASNVAITAVGTNTAATLGLSAGQTGVAGVDVAGSINGLAATGSGQYLTGVGGGAVGLKIQITGGALGSRGTVSYSQGYAQQIDNYVTSALGASGPVSTRTSGINQSVTDINKQIAALNQRLSDDQTRLLAQLNAMDTLVGQMKLTSDFLTQQFASLASVTPTGK